MARKILPAVGVADEADRQFFPRRRCGQAERGIDMLGEKHGDAFVIADPARVAHAAISQMRREQRVQAIVGERSRERLESHLLQHDVAIGIGENFLMNAVAAAALGIDQLKYRNARFDGAILEFAIALLFGKEVEAVGDDQSQVASAGLIDARKVDLVKDAVADREPDFTVLVEGSADAGLGARGPARRDAGPAGGVLCNRITHESVFLVFFLCLRWQDAIVSGRKGSPCPIRGSRPFGFYRTLTGGGRPAR